MWASATVRRIVSNQRVCRELKGLYPGWYGDRAYAEAALYDRLGGKEPVKAVTSLLFDKLIAHPELGHYFNQSTLAAHKVIVVIPFWGLGGPVFGSLYMHALDMSCFEHGWASEDLQARFLAAAFGGPNEYKGFKHPKYLVIVAGLLQDSLDELKVPKDLASEVMGVAGSLEPQFAQVGKLRELIDGAAAKA